MNTSPKLKVNRHAERGKYESTEIAAILDAGNLAHIGFIDEGIPYVMPSLYARIEDQVYIHAAIGNRLMYRNFNN
ncbi:MAG: pyridoxamine 5'-phosphate oxidase family protein [Oligoflexales bacterium]